MIRIFADFYSDQGMCLPQTCLCVIFPLSYRKIVQTTSLTAKEPLQLEFEKNANIQLPLAFVEAA